MTDSPATNVPQLEPKRIELGKGYYWMPNPLSQTRLRGDLYNRYDCIVAGHMMLCHAQELFNRLHPVDITSGQIKSFRSKYGWSLQESRWGLKEAIGDEELADLLIRKRGLCSASQPVTAIATPITAPSGDGEQLREAVKNLCWTVFQRAKGKNEEDGGPTDWFTDTLPHVQKWFDQALTHEGAALPTPSSHQAPAQPDTLIREEAVGLRDIAVEFFGLLLSQRLDIMRKLGFSKAQDGHTDFAHSRDFVVWCKDQGKITLLAKAMVEAKALECLAAAPGKREGV